MISIVIEQLTDSLDSLGPWLIMGHCLRLWDTSEKRRNNDRTRRNAPR